MKNFKSLFALFALALLVSVAGYGQTILSSTTLGAAITTTNGTLVTLAATTGMSSRGPANQINTVLYVDKEFMWVDTLVDSTHVIVERAKGTGQSTRPTLHANAATVYYANNGAAGINGAVPAARYFDGNSSPFEVANGTPCTATSEAVLPKIYLYSAHRYDCLASLWVETDGAGVPVVGATYTVPAGDILPTGSIFATDSGTAQATGLTIPHGAQPGYQISIIPGGAFTTVTSGGLANIALGSTAVLNKTLVFTLGADAKWHPSY